MRPMKPLRRKPTDAELGILRVLWSRGPSTVRQIAEQMGREASPSAAVLDSQSVKSAEKGAVLTTKWVTTPASR